MWYAAKILAASLPLKAAVTRFSVWANPANTIVPTVGRRCSFVLIHILKDVSYFYCFTTINFAKPSWRALQSMIISVTNPRPATHPIHFAADSPDKIHRCAAWAVFFFFTNKILCSCSIFQNLFLVVDRTTSKCYPYAWKKQNVVSALCPAFFILYLESFISRLNVILCHDLTLSVSEPDNAAAQTGAGTSFGANGDSHTWAETFYLFFAS